MEQSYGIPSIFAHIGEICYKGLDATPTVQIHICHPVIAIGSIRNLDFEQSLKEIHSFAPSFNLRRATR